MHVQRDGDDSLSLSNRDCVGVQSTAHVHVLKIRLSLEKPRTTPISVSFLFSGAELKKNRNATMDHQKERRIFQFDEASLNSNEGSVRTMTEGSNTSNATNLNGIQGDSTGIYEDHPGLNPSNERVVEYQGAIHEEMQRLMIGRDPQEVMAAAERVHGESNNLEFLQGQLLADFRNNGVAGEAFYFWLL
jgi:hypothetical protein